MTKKITKKTLTFDEYIIAYYIKHEITSLESTIDAMGDNSGMLEYRRKMYIRLYAELKKNINDIRQGRTAGNVLSNIRTFANDAYNKAKMAMENPINVDNYKVIGSIKVLDRFLGFLQFLVVYEVFYLENEPEHPLDVLIKYSEERWKNSLKEI